MKTDNSARPLRFEGAVAKPPTTFNGGRSRILGRSVAYSRSGCRGLAVNEPPKFTYPRQGKKWAWFKKGSGTVAGTARRVLRTTVPDPFLNHAKK